jgi:cell division protease FtsH
VRRPLIRVVVSCLVALAIIGGWRWLDRAPPEARMAFSEVMRRLEQPGALLPPGLEIAGQRGSLAEFRGHLREAGSPFVSTGWLDQVVLDRLLAADVTVRLTSPGSSSWLEALLPVLPLIVLGTLLLLFIRQLQAGPLGGRRKARARIAPVTGARVTFADVAGIDEVRGEFEETIAFLRDPRRFTRLGGHIPKGALMIGPPGTGKTLLARAIAGEAEVPFMSLSGSEFVEMFVGVGASRVRDLFAEAKGLAPCIVFIDEIDAVGRHRGSGLGGGHDEREQTLNQLLVEMDGFEPNLGVIVIGATNRPDVLDPALLRPGRFDRRIMVPRPDRGGRLGILQAHTRKTPLGPDVDLAVIARGTPGFVGADLANLVNEAALWAARGSKTCLDMADFEHAKDKVLLGAERRSMYIQESERRAIATRQAGHAVMGKLLPGSDPIYKVTIVPRGPSLGSTQQLPEDDRLHLSQQEALDQIALAMGGRVAEEAVLGQVTTGAVEEIRKATALARRMVCEWGMSERVGPLDMGGEDVPIFLGRDLSRSVPHSRRTAGVIDAEVRRIVNDNYERARRLLLAHLGLVKRVAQALLDRETLTGADLDQLVAGSAIPQPAPA